MAYTLVQAVTEVRALINESTAGFWSDTELENWIKEAVLDISTKTLLIEDLQTISVVTGQRKYTSSDEAWIANLVKIKGCTYSDGTNIRGLQRTKFNMTGHQQVNKDSRPRWYFEANKTIWIWPTPSATENGKTLEFLFSKATDDITELHDELQPYTFNYAASKAKMKDRMWQEAQLFMQAYMNNLNFERQDKYDMGADPTSTFKQP